MAQKERYHHLSFEERDSIAMYLAQGLSLCEIARRLRRNKGTISRELRRNGGHIYDAYGACSAEKRARDRKHEAGRRPRLKTSLIRSYVKQRLRKGWSPEQIVGNLRRKHPEMNLCVESIYDSFMIPGYDVERTSFRIWSGLTNDGCSVAIGIHIGSCIFPSENRFWRPAIVDRRRQFGHWESDTIIARGSQSALSVSVERVSRLTKIAQLPQRTAKNLRIALARSLSGVSQTSPTDDYLRQWSGKR